MIRRVALLCALAAVQTCTALNAAVPLPARGVVVRRPRASVALNAGGRRGALGAGALALAGALGRARPASAETVTPWPYSTLLQELDAKRISSVFISPDSKSVLTVDTDGNRHETAVFDAADLIDRLRKAKVEFEVMQPGAESLAGPLAEVLIGILPPIILIGGLLLLSRNAGPGGMGGGEGGPMAFGKSRTDINLEPDTGVTFEDVAGCDGSKLELTEVVDFLKNPAKYSAVGAKVPRGVLMEGPPGTGKTLLARAVAGEAGVPFCSASGSEFIEMFVGVGASRVRDLFTKAKKNAPCIIFIDEIDAIGRTRPGTGGGGPGGGGNDEREQTLNQILTEMDGFEGNAGVIVIGATNRGDILDPALLRPGRFDRRVPVDLPDKKGREQILAVHARGKPLDNDVTLGEVAARTTGFSGASLENLLNEAAIVAARRNATSISYKEVDYAIDRITVGLQKTGTNPPAPARQRLVSYHEAGHAVMGLLTPEYDAVTKVTIIPRSNGAGGFTLFTPSDEQLESGLYTKRYLQAQLAVALGGRVAEEIVYGEEEVTTGASSDLQQIRNIARRMVAQWGFTSGSGVDIGLVGWEAPDAGRFTARTVSGATEAQIDMEVKLLVDAAYKECYKTLEKHREFMDIMVDALIDKETIGGKELLEMLKEYDPKLHAELGKTVEVLPGTGAPAAV